MIPYYTTNKQLCEWCESSIFIGYEFELLDGMLFCDDECLKEYALEGLNNKRAFLTNEKIYMDGDY